MMEDISRELNQHLQRLYRTMVRTTTSGEVLVPLFKHGEAERVLRIEIDRERKPDVAEWLRKAMGASWFDPKREGPHHFRGVDLYVVDKLPAPGWRIVNPFAERRA